MLDHMAKHLDIFACPVCGESLRTDGDKIECLQGGHHYGIEDGIPLLFVPNEWDGLKGDVTRSVKEFYEETPFPDYEEFESLADLVQKAQMGVFARLLNEQIPFNVRVLEVGCGTGQLSNFLGISQRVVFATDMCLNSLKLGRDFRNKHGLDGVGLYQMNLFRPVFKEGSFPLVMCFGVLHHTSDPLLGFQRISSLVKKGGYIIIGLYSRYGRMMTNMRRVIFRISGGRLRFLDPRLRDKSVGELRKETWFRDQYGHVHESQHSIGEVLQWFDDNGFKYVNGYPKGKAFSVFLRNESLFKTNPRGNWLDHFMVQAYSMLSGSREGGFFIMIGKRKHDPEELSGRSPGEASINSISSQDAVRPYKVD